MKNLEKIGDCRDENLVDKLFGSVTDFACAVEENGNDFELGWLAVKYNPKTDIHTFYKK